METVKSFIVGFIFRWVLKIGGGFFLALGMSEGKIEEIIGAIVSIIIGLIVSLFQHNKALKTDSNS
jgi:ABC-type antimicrobial peptide transport system permease subunit